MTCLVLTRSDLFATRMSGRCLVSCWRTLLRILFASSNVSKSVKLNTTRAQSYSAKFVSSCKYLKENYFMKLLKYLLMLLPGRVFQRRVVDSLDVPTSQQHCCNLLLCHEVHMKWSSVSSLSCQHCHLPQQQLWCDLCQVTPQRYHSACLLQQRHY